MLQSQCYSGMMKNINHITPMGLNRNIGCIEIGSGESQDNKSTPLNRNIGCIEIPVLVLVFDNQNLLNRNIGCIEIDFSIFNLCAQKS